MNNDHDSTLPVTSATPSSVLRQKLIGCWCLRESVRTLRDGSTEHHFGRNPIGRIEYTPSGKMFALIMRPQRHSTLPAGNAIELAPPAELPEAVTGFVAYFGTFSIGENARTVTHHVQADIAPNNVGTDLTRQFELEGTSLILTRVAPDGSSSDRLVFDREPD